MHEINQICFDKSLWSSRKGFDTGNEMSEKSSVLSSNKSSFSLSTAESILQTILIAFWFGKLKSVLGFDVRVAAKSVDGNVEKAIVIPLSEVSDVDHKYMAHLRLSISHNLTLTVSGIQSRVRSTSLHSEPEVLQHHVFDFSRHLNFSGTFSEQQLLIPFLFLTGKSWAQSL